MGSYLWSAANDKLEVYFQPRFSICIRLDNIFPWSVHSSLMFLAVSPSLLFVFFPRVPALLQQTWRNRYLFTHVSTACSPSFTAPLQFFRIHLYHCTYPVSRPRRRSIIIIRNSFLSIRTSIVNNLFDRTQLSTFYSPSRNFQTVSSTIDLHFIIVNTWC